MFQIKLINENISSGTIALTWCIEPELIKIIAQYNAVDPKVVIVIAPIDEYAKETRFVVPLKDLMIYVPFKYPGHNNIFAFVTLDKQDNARNDFLSKGRYEYESGMINYDKTDFTESVKFLSNPINKEYQIFLSEPLTLDVPKECFAEEPSKFEKTWVNYFYPTPPTDQCAYRKRKILSYTIQPFVLLADILFRFCIGLFFFMLLAPRSFSFKSIFLPLSYDFDDFFGNIFGNHEGKGTYYVTKLSEQDEQELNKPTSKSKFTLICLKKFYRFLFNPIFIAIFYLFASVSYSLFSFAFVALCCTFIIILNKVFSHFKLGGLFFNSEEKVLNIQDFYVCGENSIQSFKDLPSNKKTIKLRLQNVKAKICKPFAG